MPKPLFLPLALAVAASVLAIHAACTSQRHTTYERGALAPLPARPQPRVGPGYGPEAKPPRADAQPQPRHPPVPHTPKTRGEPTIWASGEPESKPDSALLRAPIALPEEQGPRSKTIWCANQASIAFWSAEYARRDPAWLKCFANVLVLACLKAEIRNMETRVETDTAAPVHLERLVDLKPAADFAAQEVKRHCPPILDPETAQAYNGMWDFISRLKIVGGGR